MLGLFRDYAVKSSHCCDGRSSVYKAAYCSDLVAHDEMTLRRINRSMSKIIYNPRIS